MIKKSASDFFLLIVGLFLFFYSLVEVFIGISAGIHIEELIQSNILLIILGAFLILINVVFKAKEPNDERAKYLRMKSGYYGYIFSLITLFTIIILNKYNVLTPPTALYLFLSIAILCMPIIFLFLNRKE